MTIAIEMIVVAVAKVMEMVVGFSVISGDANDVVVVAEGRWLVAAGAEEGGEGGDDARIGCSSLYLQKIWNFKKLECRSSSHIWKPRKAQAGSGCFVFEYINLNTLWFLWLQGIIKILCICVIWKLCVSYDFSKVHLRTDIRKYIDILSHRYTISDTQSYSLYIWDQRLKIHVT